MKVIGILFSNTKWFRNSKLGWMWFCKYHSENDGTDEYLLWQLFYIK